MAEKKRTSQSTQSQSLAEGVDKELTCAICLSRYSQPKILPCLHSYCKECLEVMSKKSREKRNITCPQCKEVHEIPPQGIDGFTTFFTINNLLELLHIHEINDLKTPAPSIKCSSGLSESCDPAVARCLTCSDYLCESCCTIHRKLKATKDHVVKTFQEIKQSDTKSGVRSLHKKHHCHEHKDKLLELYCNTCKKAICLFCALLIHKQHDYAVIHEIRAVTQERLEKQISELQTKVIEFQSHQKYTKSLLKISNEAAKTAEAKVNQVCGALMQSIEARCAELIAEIHCVHESEVKQITLESESIHHSLSRFSGSIQFTKQLLDNGDDVEVMANSDQTTRTLTSLAQLDWDRNMLKPSLLRLKFESVEKNVSNFGRVLHTLQPDDVIVSNLPIDTLVGNECCFEVSLSKDIAERGYDALGEITISHSDTTVLAYTLVKREGFNSWSVSFTPYKPGVHQVSVKMPDSSLAISCAIDVASKQKDPYCNWEPQEGEIDWEPEPEAVEPEVESEVESEEELEPKGKPEVESEVESEDELEPKGEPEVESEVESEDELELKGEPAGAEWEGESEELVSEELYYESPPDMPEDQIEPLEQLEPDEELQQFGEEPQELGLLGLPQQHHNIIFPQYYGSNPYGSNPYGLYAPPPPGYYFKPHKPPQNR